jgi:type I restriction enzyme S subunit
MKLEEKKLPNGWEVKKLGEVCKLKNGFAFKSDDYQENGVPVIRISDINSGIVSSKDVIRVEAKDDYENYLVETNDILVAMSGATTGKFGIFKSTEKAYQNQRVGKFKILDEKILNNQFLFYQINSLKKQIEIDAYGGAQPNISSAKIEQMKIVLPPLPEQQKIVAKIEELFSELENGKKELLIAQAKLKTYRQSLLKWAFEGRLTNKNLKEGELPKGWEVKKLGEVGEIVSGGTPSTKIPEYWGGKISWITPADLSGYQNKIIFHGKKSITETGLKNSSTRLIRKGSVLFSSRAPIGYVVVAGNELCTNQGFKSIVPNEFILSEYLFYYLKSSKQKAEKVASGTTFKEISLKAFSQLEIPIPPLPEQQKIVAILESKLTICDAIEETIKTSIKQGEALRQSILKKAFEGELINKKNVT